MDTELLERLRDQMAYEFDRSGPPPGFPAFPDIPADRYRSQVFFELEKRYLWSRVWLLAGRVDDVPEPGDYVTVSLVGSPVLVIRGRDGVVRAFYNSCQHRGAPVVRDERGTARTLRCQYHSWTYDATSGVLINVPDERDFVGLVKEERCLPTLRCEIWDGWIFVNADPDAEPLLDWLGPVADQLAEFQGASLRTIRRRSEVVACNWKVTAEAFLEVYHFRHIHSRNGETQLDNRGAAMGLFPNGHSRMITPFSQSACTALGMSSWSDWQMHTNPALGDIPTVNAMVRSTSTAYSIFPNLITPLAATGFPFLLFWPIDVGHTLLEWIHYAPADWDATGALPEPWQKRLEVFDQIMEEDTRNMAPINQSIASPGLSGVRINYQERRIWHLHQQIDATIGPERIPDALRVPVLLEPDPV